MRLPHHDRIEQTVPDAMHTITDTVEKLLYLIIGKAVCMVYHYSSMCMLHNNIIGKSEEKLKGKITKAEAELERFGLNRLNYTGSSVPWQLSTADLKG